MSRQEVARVGTYYAVDPGRGAAEYYPVTLRGLGEAMARAQRLSAQGPMAQVVTKTAGRVTVPLREYQDGLETARSAAGLIPACRPVPPPSGTPAGPRIRRRPLPDINEPPCEADSE